MGRIVADAARLLTWREAVLAAANGGHLHVLIKRFIN
jgi:hypothetical protein